MINRIAPLLALILILAGLIFSMESYAANIYVDKLIQNNITDGKYSIANRDNSGSDGNAYKTIQTAINAMSPGDDILIRGGTYNEYVTIPLSKNGNARNWSSIQSFPGEWAIIDAAGSSQYVLGRLGYAKDGSENHSYWKIERLELTGGTVSGLFMNGGPIIVRFCYIHDNLATNGGANPCGIKGMIWRDCVVEFCYFKNNGSTGSPNEMHSAIGIQIHSDYNYNDSDANHPANLEACIANNTYRYNLFENTENTALSGIHHKAQQWLTSHTTVNWDHKNMGDKIHHNIFIDIPRPIGCQQDFAQIYNNIAFGASIGIELSDPGVRTSPTACVVYNNTIKGGGRLVANFGSGTYIKNPYIFWYNNMIDSPVDGDNQADMTLGSAYMSTSFDYDASRTDVTRNLIYNPDNSQEIRVLRNSGSCYGLMSLNNYNVCYNSENYSQLSTEGSDPLYQGTSGSSKYKTRGTHVIQGSATIANAGKGGGHPYFPNVTIPQYIGATNPQKDSGLNWNHNNPDPNDAGWVDYVLSLRNIKTLIAGGDLNGQEVPPRIPRNLRRVNQ